MNVAQLHPLDTASLPTDLPSLEAWFDRRLDEKLAEREAAKIPSLAIIATKGTLDMAYPPFILASTAAALGWNASIFFTFYGLELLKKDLHLPKTQSLLWSYLDDYDFILTPLPNHLFQRGHPACNNL